MNVSFNVSLGLLNFTNTNSLQNHRDVFSYEENLAVRICYTIVTCIGLIANSFVAYLIICDGKLRTVINLLVLNLAIADIIACLSIYPFIYINLAETRIRGTTANVLCGFTDGLFGFFVAAAVSLITLSMLSIIRYFGINHPYNQRWTLQYNHMKWVFGLIWVFSLALVLPNLISFKYDEYFRLCVRNWAVGVNPLIYFIFTIILGVLLPLSSLLFTYFTSFYTLFLKDCFNNNLVVSERNNVIKKRALKWLGVLVLTYIICWLPFILYWFLSVVIGKYSVSNYEDVRKGVRLARLTLFFAASNTVFNPIVYAFKSKKLRSAFKSLFGLHVRDVTNSTSRRVLTQSISSITITTTI
ncbi:somatostatin receptor type 2 isoform X1 [Hydra vulgaris]|uniref:somatostatin receptor type 2 isoform X1 n=1 Tax=Hydra vulgaris TaxID=6087 RepID=UPI001F5E5413|nr:somatostatin receptor type 2-like isoform X2 [Hydra vulgaris]